MKNLLIGLLALGSISAFAADSCSVVIKQNDRSTRYADLQNVSISECKELAYQALNDCRATLECRQHGLRRVIADHKSMSDKEEVSTKIVLKH